MITPPVRKHAPPRQTRGLGTLLAWFALICCGAAASAALALGSPMSAWLPAWLLLLLAGLGAAAGVSAAAAALDRGWYVACCCCCLTTLAASLSALLLGDRSVGRGHGFAFALPAWLGMGTATLFLCRPDAWADGYELLAELPLLLLLLHLPLASSAAASWLDAGQHVGKCRLGGATAP